MDSVIQGHPPLIRRETLPDRAATRQPDERELHPNVKPAENMEMGLDKRIRTETLQKTGASRGAADGWMEEKFAAGVGVAAVAGGLGVP